MASSDGCTLRCAVEKRTMCRDLQKWSKTLLCMIGLENVAGRLASRKKHKHEQGEQHVVHISPFVEPVLIPLPANDSQRSSQQGNDQKGEAANEDTEGKTALPHDWDPEEPCAICIQIAEKEELAKKAATSGQHSRSKKELRDRSKEAESKNVGRSLENAAAGMAGVQHKQLQQMLDWRSMTTGASSSNVSPAGLFGSMNLFRPSSASGQSSSSTSYGSAGNLAASMFGAASYPFFDFNQIYLNELLTQYNKVATAAGGGSGGSYGMMSLPMGVSPMHPQSMGYSMNTAAFSFPHLMANLTSQLSQSTGPNPTSDEPLDLTKRATATKHSMPSGRVEASGDPLKSSLTSTSALSDPSHTPQGTGKGPGSNASSNGSSSSKRTYSQADLLAAVDDIRNKKLGTRRASVVYGIPRSTLRNKIYKLEATDDDQGQTGGACASPASTSGRRKHQKVEESDKIIKEEKLGDGQCGTPVGPGAGDAACGRATTNSDDSSASLSSSSSSFCGANDLNAFGYGDAYLGNWTVSARLTAELARKQAVEALWRASEGNAPIFNKDTMSFPSSIVDGSAGVTTVLQDAVCTALTENLKLKSSLSSVPFDSTGSPLSMVSSMTPKQSSSSKRPSSRRRGADKSPATMVKIERPAQSGSSNTDETGESSKKIRPKRGQYRKYDKNALAEAVHAVRRGEMSVHRAGSFYGVPHSTLEYKVKERNLLRPKKRDLKKKLEEMESGGAQGANGQQSTEDTPKETENTPSEQAAETEKGKTECGKKSKKSKKSTDCETAPAVQCGSPFPTDGFNSLSSLASSLDSSAVEPLAKMKKPSALDGSPSSPAALPTGSALNLLVEGPSDQPEAGVSGEQSEYSMLKAYEDGYKAALGTALLSATDIFQRFQMQPFPSSNGGSNWETDAASDQDSQKKDE